jgi:riboflavin kinase / FMN adenylyltransferase
MKIIRCIEQFESSQPTAVTIGNFDGVHKAHQAILQRLMAAAKKRDCLSSVIIFDPHPREFFAIAQAPTRLTSLDEKLKVFDTLGIDQVFVLPFDQHLSAITASEFLETFLISCLNMRYLLVGEDFRFGQGRQGDVALLNAYAANHPLQMEMAETCLHDSHRISSTRIRQALNAGDLSTAEKLLGRPYSISGEIVHGDQRGRELGFPTANIALNRSRAPLCGVFVVVALGLSSTPLHGIANLGTRPTVNGKREILEVYLLDFNQDIYGQSIRVVFLKKLRDEKRFDSLDALVVQMKKDEQIARDYFEVEYHG